MHEAEKYWQIMKMPNSLKCLRIGKFPNYMAMKAPSAIGRVLKKQVLVLGVKKSLICRPNTRSSHFVAPSLSNGCTMACSYCYVPRRKGYSNPFAIFVNIEQIMNYLRKHTAKQGIFFAA